MRNLFLICGISLLTLSCGQYEPGAKYQDPSKPKNTQTVPENQEEAGLRLSGTPSAKATARVGDIAILDSQELDYTTIITSYIKTPNGKDLFMDVSMECGLFTKTHTKSKGGEKDTSSAEAYVSVRVLVDGEEAHPGEVTFCQRSQELSAIFNGLGFAMI